VDARCLEPAFMRIKNTFIDFEADGVRKPRRRSISQPPGLETFKPPGLELARHHDESDSDDSSEASTDIERAFATGVVLISQAPKLSFGP